MRRLHLHIGMHKTGSTAIQLAMKDFDDGRLAYLKLEEANHSRSLVYMFRESGMGGLIARGYAKDAAEFRQKGAALREALAERLAGTARDCIVSGEDLSGGFGPDDVRRLRDFFAGYFDDIRIIVYIRPPVPYMTSSFQERLKAGPVPFDLQGCYPFYRARLQPWEAAFGREAITYICFSRETLADGDAVTDFAGRVGIPAGSVRSARVNESMSAEAVSILYLIRRKLRDDDPWPPRRALLRLWARKVVGFGSTPFEFDRSAWGDMLTAHMDDIAWMEERLGRVFPEHRPKAGAVVFRGEPDLVAYARSLWPAFLHWAWTALFLSAARKELARHIAARSR